VVLGRYRTITKPIKFAGTPGPQPCPSPTFGQHSGEILAEHGYSIAEIPTLRERGVVCFGIEGGPTPSVYQRPDLPMRIPVSVGSQSAPMGTPP